MVESIYSTTIYHIECSFLSQAFFSSVSLLTQWAVLPAQVINTVTHACLSALDIPANILQYNCNTRIACGILQKETNDHGI